VLEPVVPVVLDPVVPALPEGVVLWSVPVVPVVLLPVPAAEPVPWSVLLPVVPVAEPLPVLPAPPDELPLPVCAKAIAPEITTIPRSVSVLFISNTSRDFFLTSPMSSIIRRS
jgi:hypothetical protein